MPLAHPALSALLLAAAFASQGSNASWAAEHETSEARPAVQVIDGDTLQIDEHTIQLYGIDAPELGQHCQRGGDLWACGVEAALFLQKTVTFEGPPMECAPWREGADEAPREPIVGVCQIGPKQVGLTMVRNGYALALPDSFPDYQEAEEQARQATLGLWQSEFVPPWQWRTGKGAEASSSDWVRSCNVKGALGPADERVYYVPTDRAYESVAINPAQGERMFCSDEEARAAGWTRPDDTTAPR